MGQDSSKTRWISAAAQFPCLLGLRRRGRPDGSRGWLNLMPCEASRSMFGVSSNVEPMYPTSVQPMSSTRKKMMLGGVVWPATTCSGAKAADSRAMESRGLDFMGSNF